MTIEPDSKDWTWVLRRPCPECGLDTQSFPRDKIGGMVRANAAAWQRVLTGRSDPRLRPNLGKWSALEYGCHVRDVLRLYEQRLTLMLTHDGPQFPNWDQDATAVEGHYEEQDAVVVAGTQAPDPTPTPPQSRGSRAGGTIHTLPADYSLPAG
jgi:hypothetical protein